ncbi:hypothetical protein AB2J22_12290 [Aeromonas sp. A5]
MGEGLLNTISGGAHQPRLCWELADGGRQQLGVGELHLLVREQRDGLAD